VKTITTQQAAEQFTEFARMANAGERILVTQDGEPWVVLEAPHNNAILRAPSDWPDFQSYWRKNFPDGPIQGPSATQLLAHEKEDRF
jgi:antitoxin (DNA-binding transcriptional repressor) of toxin-antitoxin stability system